MGRCYTAVRLSEKDRKLIESIASKYDLTISDVIRMAVREFLEKDEIKIKEESQTNSI
jgi:replication initiation and membrane attachment protein DnaB